MKTINKDIDIFNTEKSALKAFNKLNHADLLYSPQIRMYYVDKTKTAIKDWPQHYKLINTK